MITVLSNENNRHFERLRVRGVSLGGIGFAPKFSPIHQNYLDVCLLSGAQLQVEQTDSQGRIPLLAIVRATRHFVTRGWIGGAITTERTRVNLYEP